MKKQIIGLLGMAIGCSLAQPASTTDKDKLPPLPNPIIQRAPDLSQWTIQSGGASSLASGADSRPDSGTSSDGKAPPMKTTIVKSGKTYFIAEVDPLGRTWEKWNVDGKQVTFDPRTNEAIIRTSGSNGTTYTNFGSEDFFGFGWLSDQSYVDFKDVRGHKCYLFRTSLKDPETGEITILTAAVDSETRMPVFLAVDSVVTTYQFGPAPSAPLTIPSKVSSALTQYVQSLPPLPRRWSSH